MCIAFNIVDDLVVEAVEMFVISLSSSDPGINVTLGSAIVHILPDRDSTLFGQVLILLSHYNYADVTVGFEKSTYMIREGNNSVETCISLTSMTLERNVSVNVSFIDGTAGRSFFSPLIVTLNFKCFNILQV